MRGACTYLVIDVTGLLGLGSARCCLIRVVLSHLCLLACAKFALTARACFLLRSGGWHLHPLLHLLNVLLQHDAILACPCAMFACRSCSGSRHWTEQFSLALHCPNLRLPVKTESSQSTHPPSPRECRFRSKPSCTTRSSISPHVCSTWARGCSFAFCWSTRASAHSSSRRRFQRSSSRPRVSSISRSGTPGKVIYLPGSFPLCLAAEETLQDSLGVC